MRKQKTPPVTPMGISFPPELARKIKADAKAHSTPVSRYVRAIVEEWYEKIHGTRG